MMRTVGAAIAKFGSVRLVCVHWRTFPPKAAIMELEFPIEELRASKKIEEEDYQRYLVWKRICGLLKMNRRRCRKCPHVRFLDANGNPTLRKLDGSGPVPIVDLPTLENRSRRAPTHLTVKKSRTAQLPLKPVGGKDG